MELQRLHEVVDSVTYPSKASGPGTNTSVQDLILHC